MRDDLPGSDSPGTTGPVVLNRRSGNKVAVLVRGLMALAIWSGLIGAAGAGALYVHASRDLPSIDCFDELMEASVTRFEAADGQLVGWRYRSKREAVDWNHIPRKLVLALLASEDQRYFFHGGIDIKGLGRAILSLGSRGGGSSLTQQLAKELFTKDCDAVTEPGVPCEKRCVTFPARDACRSALEPDGSPLWATGRRLWSAMGEEDEEGKAPGLGLCSKAAKVDEILGRKVPEAIMARRMEDVFTKQQILTWYLNRKWFGQGCYGIQTAAHHYFGRDVWNLSLAQMTMLVGMLPAPHLWNPYRNLEKSRDRMRDILKVMERNQWITPEERERALAEGMDPRFQVFDGRGDYTDHVPYFTSHAFRDVAERFSEATADEDAWLDRGLSVSMQVEPAHQAMASASLGDALERLATRQGYPGPLGQLDRDEFLERIKSWIPHEGLQKGDRTLGRVRRVQGDNVQVELGDGELGLLRLEDARWAGPNSEAAPKKRRKRKDRVSLDGQLKDMRKAFAVGDIIFAELKDVEGPRRALRLVPIPLMEGALVSYPVVSGGLDTLVGGWDFDRNQNRRYLSDSRQLASTMKPIYYAWRYDQGMPPSALLSGATYTGGGYDAQGDMANDVTAWEALVFSRDTAAQRIFSGAMKAACRDEDPQCSPRDRYRDWGQRMGLVNVDRHLKGEQAEALGSHAQPPLAMAHAYGTFASRGMAPRAPLIRTVVDRDGRMLERRIQPLDPHASTEEAITALWDIALPSSTQADHRGDGTFGRPLGTRPSRQISPVTAYLTTSNLVEVVERGTGRKFRRRLPNGKRAPAEVTKKLLAREAAGKTGTLPYDVWFDGFTFDRVAVTWIGADRQERPLGRSVASSGGVFGGNTALPAWADFMAGVQGDAPAREMTDRHLVPIEDQIAWWRVQPGTGLASDCHCVDETGTPLRACTSEDGIRIAHRAATPPDVHCPQPDMEEDEVSEDDL